MQISEETRAVVERVRSYVQSFLAHVDDQNELRDNSFRILTEIDNYIGRVLGDIVVTYDNYSKVVIIEKGDEEPVRIPFEYITAFSRQTNADGEVAKIDLSIDVARLIRIPGYMVASDA